jgi:hypothetical protein
MVTAKPTPFELTRRGSHQEEVAPLTVVKIVCIPRSKVDLYRAVLREP